MNTTVRLALLAALSFAGTLPAQAQQDPPVTIDSHVDIPFNYMGEPRFEWDAISLSDAMDTLDMPVAWDDLERPSAVNVGNPHAIFFVDDPYAVDMARLGPLVETDPVFPERVNVNVAAITARDAITLRVWERGAGLTRACGTGACATAVGAMKRGLVDRKVTVTLPGGQLAIEWREDDVIVMTGPAAESFRGSFDPADYSIAARSPG